MLRAQVNGYNIVKETHGCKIDDAVLRGRRWFAYRVGGDNKPVHRFRSYASVVEWLKRLDGRGYVTVDGVMVLRNWL